MFKQAKSIGRARSRIYVFILATISLAVCATAGSISCNSLGADTEKSFMDLMHEAMASMDKAMGSAPMTGDPDHDFAAMMIPHHQGAIDMAKAELLYGKDTALRRLAQEIVVTQEQEIEVMRTRLKQLKLQ